MLKIIRSLSFLALSFFPITLLAQHDFDSLYDASAAFRKSFETIQDTFDLFGNESVLAIGVFQPENIDLIAVFQYMIGNTDWSIPAQHNMKLLKSKDPNIFTPVAVPYDFDYCGFVNPPYAIPSEILPIEDITERLYRGPCREDVGEYDPILDKFMQKKNDLYALIENSGYLNKNSKKHMISYLDSFYQIITNPKQVNAALSANCKKYNGMSHK